MQDVDYGFISDRDVISSKEGLIFFKLNFILVGSEFSKRHRNSSKRYATQPVDREEVAQAKKLQEQYQAEQVI